MKIWKSLSDRVKQHIKKIELPDVPLNLLLKIKTIMTTYYKQTEIKAAIDSLVDDCLMECKRCEELPEGFVELIKHNFLAKYVCYDKDTKTIEIGVEDNSRDALYPSIKVHKYSLNARSWVRDSFRNDKNDLQFYGQLINRNRSSKDAEVVLM